MKIKPYDDNKHSEVMDWFVGHGWDAPPIDVLPEDGFVVEGVAAGWIYFGEPKMAFIGWPVGNPKANRKEVYLGLELVLSTLGTLAKDRGAKLIWAWTSKPGLLKLYERLGYIVGDANSTNMVLGL